MKIFVLTALVFVLTFRHSHACGPAELASFDAVGWPLSVQLHWVTASESNTEYWIIYRLHESDSVVVARTIAGAGPIGADYCIKDNAVVGGETYTYGLGLMCGDSVVEILGMGSATPSGGQVAPRIPTVLNDMSLMLHPNPFNGNTTIEFELPRQSLIGINVFDVQGRLIRELENRVFPAGSHQVMFDGSDLASGIYFARLTQGVRAQTLKMVLMK